MLNVLFASSSSDLTRGGQMSTYHLARGLDQRVVTPLIMGPEQGALLDALRREGIDTMVCPLPRLRMGHGWSIIRKIWQMVCFVKEKNIAVIHCEYSRGVFYLGWVALLLRIPLIWHVRVYERECYWVDQMLFSLARRVVVVSASCRARFQRLGRGMRKVRVIYNGVESPDASSRGELPRQGMPPEVLKVGIVGQVAPLKGQEDFIKAAAIVVVERPQTRFFIIGAYDQAYYNYLVRMIHEKNLEGHICWMGFQPSIVSQINDLDILVNASFSEGFSRSILEAMVLAKPVVATNVGGNPEAVVDGETGFLVEVNQPEAMATAILRLLRDDALRRHLGQNGRARVEKHFLLKQTIQAMQALIMEVAR